MLGLTPGIGCNQSCSKCTREECTEKMKRNDKPCDSHPYDCKSCWADEPCNPQGVRQCTSLETRQ